MESALMRKVIAILLMILTCFCICFSLFGCDLFNHSENNQVSKAEEGFFAEITYQAFTIQNPPAGMQLTSYKYAYEYKLWGNLAKEASYKVEVQVALYVNGEYDKTSIEEHTLSGQGNKIVSKTVNYSYSKYSTQPTVEAKIVKVSWQ